MTHHQRRWGGGSGWDLETQARKASRRDWLVLTCKEMVGGGSHTNSGAEKTTKGRSDCVNKASEKSLCIWRTDHSREHIFLF